jgi:RsiW-degrading membrane proteinase PrsW (M82 family)
MLLQVNPGDVPNWAISTSQGLNFIAAAIGIFIAYQAYRGYRRNESKPMLFLAIGFVLALGLPLLLAIPTLLLPGEPVVIGVLSVLTQVFTIAGLLAILYAIRMPS